MDFFCGHLVFIFCTVLVYGGSIQPLIPLHIYSLLGAEGVGGGEPREYHYLSSRTWRKLTTLHIIADSLSFVIVLIRGSDTEGKDVRLHKGAYHVEIRLRCGWSFKLLIPSTSILENVHIN